MQKYPEIIERGENLSGRGEKMKDPLQTSTEIINDEICLDDDYEKKEKPSSLPEKKFSQNKESIKTKFQMPKDSFMDRREVEIKEVKTTTEW